MRSRNLQPPCGAAESGVLVGFDGGHEVLAAGKSLLALDLGLEAGFAGP
ncbi:hypothetical protein [Streptomyces prasinus]